MPHDLTGQTFSNLTVVGPAASQRGGRWICRCTCGSTVEVHGSNLTRERPVKSCGCVRKATYAAMVTHGLNETPTHRSWVSMKSRCNDKNNPRYSAYGGRGISVCERWLSFENFLADMGERPDGLTLDRERVNGNYELGNCRWADRETQANNTRRTRYIEHLGRRQSLAQWCRELGIPYARTLARLDKSGMPVERALAP